MDKKGILSKCTGFASDLLKNSEVGKQMEVAKCPNCGQEVHAHATFCGHCGYQMKQPSIGIQAADKAVVSVVKQSVNSGTVKAESAPQNLSLIHICRGTPRPDPADPEAAGTAPGRIPRRGPHSCAAANPPGAG